MRSKQQDGASASSDTHDATMDARKGKGKSTHAAIPDLSSSEHEKVKNE